VRLHNGVGQMLERDRKISAPQRSQFANTVQAITYLLLEFL